MQQETPMAISVTDTVRIDPATRFVRSLPGDYFLLREAAEACGVSQYTLRAMISDDVPECTPSKYAMFGKIKIYLYTREDIENIRHHLGNRHKIFNHTGMAKRIGRPPTYTKDERANRSRLYSKAWYWRNREKVLLGKGDLDKAREARERAIYVEEELHRDKGGNIDHA
jgi:hypothetical protein